MPLTEGATCVHGPRSGEPWRLLGVASSLRRMLTHTRDELQADYLRLIGRTGDEPGTLTIDEYILRYSMRSSVVDTLVFSESLDEPVAQAVVTYVPVLASE